MPPQSRAAQGFAGVAVEIDLILKGIKTKRGKSFKICCLLVEIDLILKGIKTRIVPRSIPHLTSACGNRPDSQRD